VSHQESFMDKVIIERLPDTREIPGAKRWEEERGEFAQISYQEAMNHLAAFQIRKGFSRGNHYHEDKEEIFYVFQGKIKALFLDMDTLQKQERILEKGIVILWVEPEKEPTRHIFNDLPRLKPELDEWGGYFLFLTDPAIKWDGFKKEELESLPANLLCGYDNKLLYSDFKSIDPSGIRLPFVILTDRKGNIIYASSGYRIGIGEQILRFAR